MMRWDGMGCDEGKKKSTGCGMSGPATGRGGVGSGEFQRAWAAIESPSQMRLPRLPRACPMREPHWPISGRAPRRRPMAGGAAGGAHRPMAGPQMATPGGDDAPDWLRLADRAPRASPLRARRKSQPPPLRRCAMPEGRASSDPQVKYRP
ncbi:hypothetical protein Purlil1_3423 [Purpureocillium lilacinum]|uniref:Uncharacterized protein n=1 Tax=Purpureocillium lilacinum TaxID=33203 RepID=A0ABR0C7L0_PURLI|nr:hypothetical protein Purlil1_3423 [Purpureocillium lilacinum]